MPTVPGPSASASTFSIEKAPDIKPKPNPTKCLLVSIRERIRERIGGRIRERIRMKVRRWIRVRYRVRIED